MSDREKIFEWLNNCPVLWEINFDDFELLSVNFIYDDDNDEVNGE